MLVSLLKGNGALRTPVKRQHCDSVFLMSCTQNHNKESENLNPAPALPTVNSYEYLLVVKAETF